MSLKQTIAPATAALSVEDIRESSNIYHDEQEAFIIALIEAATLYYEKKTRRQVISATFEQKIDRWPSGTEIVLGVSDVTSISSVTYVDSDGNSQTLSAGVYAEDLDTVPQRICLTGSLPSLHSRTPLPVTITFEAGYADRDSVPAIVRVPLMQLVGHFYENREAVLIGVPSKAMEIQFGAMLDAMTVPRIF